MLNVIYEDNHIIVVVKEANIPTQGDKTGDIDLLSKVKEYIKIKYNKPGNVYVGLVHRLDRMTSGLIVFAKTSKAASRLSKYIREGNFKKKYRCIVNGNTKDSERLINYLVKNEKTNTSRVTDENNKNAKLAILKYTTIKRYSYNNKEYSLLEVDLETGRHHQIRVQMSNIGHPLVYDVKYGSKTKGNLALYSSYLSFYHPTKDEYLEFNYDILDNENCDNIWKVSNK